MSKHLPPGARCGDHRLHGGLTAAEPLGHKDAGQFANFMKVWDMSCSLNSLKTVIYEFMSGSIIGVVKGDTRNSKSLWGLSRC